MRRLGLLLCTTVVVLYAGPWVTTAEEECLKGSYWCYECDSLSDLRCGDPFNVSAHPNDLPTLKQCEGCCVKIVRNASTPREVIHRTCTKSLQINLFIVDHVCMYEGDNTGHMCFCERDNCNASPPSPSTRVNVLWPAISALLLTAVTSRRRCLGGSL